MPQPHPQKQVLDPYKTIATFTHGPSSTSTTSPFSLAMCTYTSFKIYSQELAIKMVSPVFQSPIKAIYVHNQFTYILVGRKIVKIQYHHVVKEWTLPYVNNSMGKCKQYASMLVFGNVIIVSIGTHIYTVPEQQQQYQFNQQIQSMDLKINIIAIAHPVTYINKILAYSHTQLMLINPITHKILFTYPLEQYLSQNKKISIVKTTPLVDIVAICLDSGEILILNIRSSKLIFTMKQKKTVTAIAFSSGGDSFMATGDETGNIILWDLEHKSIKYRLQGAFTSGIDFICFVPGLPLITAGSSQSNAVRQFRINLDDVKTLTLFRQRAGCPPSSPITHIKCHNNKQITFSTKSNTVFSSLYSHSNMYSLPCCLDSALPYHVVSKNFTLQLYKERTAIGKINVHEYIQIATISLSKNFVLIGTKSRVIKLAIPSQPTTHLHINCQWKVNEANQILLNRQKYVYILCFSSIYVFNFNANNMIATVNDGDHCYSPCTNINQSMLAIQNRDRKMIQIWDMGQISLSREFGIQNNTNKLCFTPDNRYLLSAHSDRSLKIWSIFQSSLYKTITTEQNIIQMCFTPDNGYFLSVFEQAKQINIWHNYIGKITSNQSENQLYTFVTSLNYLCSDYRQKLNSHSQGNESKLEMTKDGEELDKFLDEVEDAEDITNDQINFENVSKWMPLVYYDQIKSRNTVVSDEKGQVAMPFFLDFKNLSEEQEKINKEMRQEIKDKKQKQKDKIDENLSNDSHEIRLNQNSTEQQFLSIWSILSTLSVAEVDYQLRKFLLLSGNVEHLLRMFAFLLQKQKCQNYLIFNIILTRVLELAGSQICNQNNRQISKNILQRISQKVQRQQQVILRCVAVADHHL